MHQAKKSITALAILAICLAGAGGDGVAGDFQDEHPEWFGLTAPSAAPPQALGCTQPLSRALVAPQVGQSWLTLMGFLVSRGQLTVLHDGPDEKEVLLAWLNGGEVETDDLIWVDAGAQETIYTGDWGPMPVLLPEGMAAVDGRYFGVRPRNDAMGSQWVMDQGGPVFRVPLFLTRNHWTPAGEGRCLVSQKIFTTNPGLSDAAIKHLMHQYLGCAQVLVLEPLPDEGEGRLDLLVRAPAQDMILLGNTSFWSQAAQAVLDDNRAVLESGMGEDLELLETPLPDPVAEVQGGFRSYLTYLVAEDALLVPTFYGFEFEEEQALLAIGAAHPGLEIVTLPADILAEGGLWPTRMVATLPADEWAGVEQPENLCETGHLDDCGLCADECFAAPAYCEVGMEAVVTCEEGVGGCMQRIVSPCEGEELCTDGECDDPPGPCQGVPPGGICEGDVKVICAGDTLIKVDCQEEGKFCSLTEENVAECITPCQNQCLEEGEQECRETEEGTFSALCVADKSGCLDWQLTPCTDSQDCQDGVCWEIPAGDAVGAEDVVYQSDTVNAGFGSSDSGCSPGAPSSALVWLLSGILLLWGLSRSGRFQQ